jgi:hypothetical protein
LPACIMYDMATGRAICIACRLPNHLMFSITWQLRKLDASWRFLQQSKEYHLSDHVCFAYSILMKQWMCKYLGAGSTGRGALMLCSWRGKSGSRSWKQYRGEQEDKMFNSLHDV